MNKTWIVSFVFASAVFTATPALGDFGDVGPSARIIVEHITRQNEPYFEQRPVTQPVRHDADQWHDVNGARDGTCCPNGRAAPRHRQRHEYRPESPRYYHRQSKTEVSATPVHAKQTADAPTIAARTKQLPKVKLAVKKPIQKHHQKQIVHQHLKPAFSRFAAVPKPPKIHTQKHAPMQLPTPAPVKVVAEVKKPVEPKVIAHVKVKPKIKPPVKPVTLLKLPEPLVKSKKQITLHTIKHPHKVRKLCHIKKVSKLHTPIEVTPTKQENRAVVEEENLPILSAVNKISHMPGAEKYYPPVKETHPVKVVARKTHQQKVAQHKVVKKKIVHVQKPKLLQLPMPEVHKRLPEHKMATVVHKTNIVGHKVAHKKPVVVKHKTVVHQKIIPHKKIVAHTPARIKDKVHKTVMAKPKQTPIALPMPTPVVKKQPMIAHKVEHKPVNKMMHEYHHRVVAHPRTRHMTKMIAQEYYKHPKPRYNNHHHRHVAKVHKPKPTHKHKLKQPHVRQKAFKMMFKLESDDAAVDEDLEADKV